MGIVLKGSLCQSTFSVMSLISQWLFSLTTAPSQICGIILAPFSLSHPCLIMKSCQFSFRICPGSKHFHSASLLITITLVIDHGFSRGLLQTHIWSPYFYSYLPLVCFQHSRHCDPPKPQTDLTLSLKILQGLLRTKQSLRPYTGLVS